MPASIAHMVIVHKAFELLRTKGSKELQEFARRSMERQPPAAYIGALKAMAERVDSTALLASFRFPIVVIHGDADQLIPLDRAREVKAARPAARLE